MFQHIGNRISPFKRQISSQSSVISLTSQGHLEIPSGISPALGTAGFSTCRSSTGIGFLSLMQSLSLSGWPQVSSPASGRRTSSHSMGMIAPITTTTATTATTPTSATSITRSPRPASSAATGRRGPRTGQGIASAIAATTAAAATSTISTTGSTTARRCSSTTR